MASYKIPQHYEFRDNLPKNESGKIMKTQFTGMGENHPRGVYA